MLNKEDVKEVVTSLVDAPLSSKEIEAFESLEGWAEFMAAYDPANLEEAEMIENYREAEIERLTEKCMKVVNDASK